MLVQGHTLWTKLGSQASAALAQAESTQRVFEKIRGNSCYYGIRKCLGSGWCLQNRQDSLEMFVCNPAEHRPQICNMCSFFTGQVAWYRMEIEPTAKV